MSRNFGQWGQAKFSDLRDLDIRVSDTLATAYFTFTSRRQTRLERLRVPCRKRATRGNMSRE
jgi:hypothetical protein